MKQIDIKNLSTEDLIEKVEEYKVNLTKLKLGHGVSMLENPMKIKSTRRAVARFNTEIRKRELQEMK